METGKGQNQASEIEALQASLKARLQFSEGSANVQTELSAAALADPEVSFQAAYRLLESMAASPDRTKVYHGLLGCSPFLLELIRKERFNARKLVQICRRFAAIEKRLDLGLANLLPKRWDDLYRLEPELVARILDVLNEISVGPRLIGLVSHLTAHPQPAVAEKATVLVGRRICNYGWTRRHLESGGPDIRAGVVQGLWGLDTVEARRVLRKCLEDSDERVVGNAVFGLHLLKEADVPVLVERMIADARPAFRSTAAWLAGQIGEAGYSGLLQLAKNDGEASVRLAAKQALIEVRHLAEGADVLPEVQPAGPDRPEVQHGRRPKDFLEELPAKLKAPPTKPEKKPAKKQPRGSDGTTRWD